MARGRAGGSRPGRTPRPRPGRRKQLAVPSRKRGQLQTSPTDGRSPGLPPPRPTAGARAAAPAGQAAEAGWVLRGGGGPCAPGSRAAFAEDGGTGRRSPTFVLLAEARTPAA